MHAMHDRLSTFLIHLECLSQKSQLDAVINEVIETNGRFDPPRNDLQTWWHLDLHQIVGTGRTELEAVATWKRHALDKRPHSGAGDDCFSADTMGGQ